MANVIYRGPVKREPITINIPVDAALLPGTIVRESGDVFTTATDATGRLLVLSNRRFYGQGPDEAYGAGETAVAYRIEGDQEYQARFAAGTYALGDALTVNGSGQMAAAAAGDLVVAYYDGEGATLVAGDRDDIVTATNSHIASA